MDMLGQNPECFENREHQRGQGVDCSSQGQGGHGLEAQQEQLG